MALHYSAHQYEQAYKPRVLRNWEVPKQYYDKPHKRKGRTEIISNDRGHLLPGVPKSDANPWGNYTGTWHLPKKIDRKLASELNGTDPKQVYRCKCKVIHAETGKDEEETKHVEADKTEIKTDAVVDSMQKEHSQQEEERNKENIENNKNTAIPYVPGDLTEEKHRPPEYDLLAENRFGRDKPEIRGYPKYREDFSRLPQIEENTITRDEIEETYKQHRDMKEVDYMPENENQHQRKSKTKSSSTFLTALKNFQLAKKLHRENLEHDPLPDTISHPKYKKLQMERDLKEPGLMLSGENYATGVGWKGYPGYGPNRCTKLKVYRPKTCVENKNQRPGDNGRPNSVNSFDLKWRFIRQRKVSPIELAICWDLTPEDPKDEPKRTPHIDGSNGSLAPAVFTLVHTPKEDSAKSSICLEDENRCAPLFEKGPDKNPEDKDFILDRPKTSVNQRRTSNLTVSSGSGDSLAKKRAKSAYNLDKDTDDKCSKCSYDELKNDLRQSTPNLTENKDNKRNKNRTCMACQLKKISLNKEKSSDFKMAFKAGVPQFRKDKRQDYPEHWRLATVYQHSYKPIHTRKRPMLETVFK